MNEVAVGILQAGFAIAVGVSVVFGIVALFMFVPVGWDNWQAHRRLNQYRVKHGMKPIGR